MPDDIFVRAQFEDFANLLRDRPGPAAILLAQLLGKVTAHDVDIPGKARGYKRLRFRLQTGGALRIAFGERFPKAITTALKGNLADECPEFSLDIGGPSKMDLAAPTIADLRAAGVSWKEIGKEVNLAPANAYTAWKRFMNAQPVAIDVV